MGSKQSILRIVRIRNVSFSQFDHKVLVENGVGNLIGAHFGLRLGLSIQTGVHDREEPVFEERQLVTADLVAIACHLGLAVAAHLKLGVPISPAVPFQHILSVELRERGKFKSLAKIIHLNYIVKEGRTFVLESRFVSMLSDLLCYS